jgi:hypothetical protein
LQDYQQGPILQNLNKSVTSSGAVACNPEHFRYAEYLTKYSAVILSDNPPLPFSFGSLNVLTLPTQLAAHVRGRARVGSEKRCSSNKIRTLYKAE